MQSSIITQQLVPVSHLHSHKYISCLADGEAWRDRWTVVVTFWRKATEYPGAHKSNTLFFLSHSWSFASTFSNKTLSARGWLLPRHLSWQILTEKTISAFLLFFFPAFYFHLALCQTHVTIIVFSYSPCNWTTVRPWKHTRTTRTDSCFHVISGKPPEPRLNRDCDCWR